MDIAVSACFDWIAYDVSRLLEVVLKSPIKMTYRISHECLFCATHAKTGTSIKNRPRPGLRLLAPPENICGQHRSHHILWKPVAGS